MLSFQKRKTLWFQVAIFITAMALLPTVARAATTPLSITKSGESRSVTGGGEGNLYNQLGGSSFLYSSFRLATYPPATFSQVLADDFYVPGRHKWRISKITVDGVWSSSFNFNIPNSFQITIYADNNGKPGKIIFSRAVVDSDPLINPQSGFTPHRSIFQLSSPISLDMGSYWFSVSQNNADFFNGPGWGWWISGLNDPLLGYQPSLIFTENVVGNQYVKTAPQSQLGDLRNVSFAFDGIDTVLQPVCGGSLNTPKC